MKIICGRCAAIFFALLSGFSAHAADQLAYTLFDGDSPRIGRLGLQWKLPNPVLPNAIVSIGTYVETPSNRWRSPQFQNFRALYQRQGEFDMGAVLRIQERDRRGFYAEAGTGPQYLADYYDLTGRPQSNQFSFQAHAGIGFVWKNGIDVGFRATHFSTGRSKDLNDSSNTFGMGVRYWW